MEDNSDQKMQALETKIDAIFTSVEKTRKYFRVTMWVTIIFFVAPLVAMMFVMPFFLNSYLGSIGADGSALSGLVDQSQLDLMRELLQ